MEHPNGSKIVRHCRDLHVLQICKDCKPTVVKCRPPDDIVFDSNPTLNQGEPKSDQVGKKLNTRFYYFQLQCQFFGFCLYSACGSKRMNSSSNPASIAGPAARESTLELSFFIVAPCVVLFVSFFLFAFLSSFLSPSFHFLTVPSFFFPFLP